MKPHDSATADYIYAITNICGLHLRDMVLDFARSPIAQAKIEPGSDVDKHLQLACAVVSVFHHSELGASGEADGLHAHARNGLNEEGDPNSDFGINIAKIRTIDLPRFNERKDLFLEAREYLQGVNLVTDLMGEVFQQTGR